MKRVRVRVGDVWILRFGDDYSKRTIDAINTYDNNRGLLAEHLTEAVWEYAVTHVHVHFKEDAEDHWLWVTNQFVKKQGKSITLRVGDTWLWEGYEREIDSLINESGFAVSQLKTAIEGSMNKMVFRKDPYEYWVTRQLWMKVGSEKKIRENS